MKCTHDFGRSLLLLRRFAPWICSWVLLMNRAYSRINKPMALNKICVKLNYFRNRICNSRDLSKIFFFYFLQIYLNPHIHFKMWITLCALYKYWEIVYEDGEIWDFSMILTYLFISCIQIYSRLAPLGRYRFSRRAHVDQIEIFWSWYPGI